MSGIETSRCRSSHIFVSHPFMLLRTFALPAKELSCLADIEAGMGGEGVVDDDVAALPC